MPQIPAFPIVGQVGKTCGPIAYRPRVAGFSLRALRNL
jgi:hypothetical protein